MSKLIIRLKKIEQKEADDFVYSITKLLELSKFKPIIDKIYTEDGE